MPGQQAPKRNPFRANQVGYATFSFTAEAANARTVSIQLQDERRRDLAVRGDVRIFLSDDANGDTLTATAADGGIAAGTDGWFASVVTGKMGFARSESDGDIDIVVTHTGVKTYYVGVVLPDGTTVMSSALAFA